jgi:hypothetical protein
LIQQGILINDDNQHALENIAITTTNDNIEYYNWGFNGFCERRKEHLTRFPAKLQNYIGQHDYMSLFEHLFPEKRIKEVLIKEKKQIYRR